MQKVSKIFVGALALGACSLAMPSVATYAVGEYIYVNNSAENLYVESGVKSNSAGTVTYDAGNNTLTLNGYSGGGISVNLGTDVDLKVVFSGNNTITVSNATANALALGAKTTVLSGTGTMNMASSSNGICLQDTKGVMTIESGTYTFKCSEGIYLAASATPETSLTINGGDFAFDGGVGIKAGAPVVFNDGTYTMTGDATYFFSSLLYKGKVTINGGEFDLATSNVDGSNYAFNAAGDFVVNDGTIKTNFNGGITTDNGNIIINDGELNLTAKSYPGIAQYTAGAYGVEFNDGVTKLSTTSGPTVATRGNNGVKFGESMGIVEAGEYVGAPYEGAALRYMYNSNGTYATMTTIQKIERSNDNTDDVDSTDSADTSSTGVVATPNTGTTTGDGSGDKADALLYVLPVIVMVALGVGGYAYQVKKAHRKFER